eukprot:jgi/Hompol1/1862/HPOL_003757-RA
MINADANTLILGALYIINFISDAVFTGGISDQAQYGLGGICLLFLENYHYDDTLKANLFSAYSGVCSLSVSVGSFGFLALAIVALGRFYFIYKNELPAKRIIFVFAVISTVFAVIFFIMAAVVTAGINQTCSQFASVEKYRSCADVFSDGFFADNTANLHSKNLNTVKAAVGAAWMTFLSWGALAGYEWFNYKNAAAKWW